MFDLSSEFGKRAQRRLEKDLIGWLTTVSANGTPCPRPVWFLWNGETVLIFSRPDTHKVRHIANNPNVALNLDGDGEGGDIVVIQGVAEIEPAAPQANRVGAYLRKYEEGLKRINMDAEQFALVYSVAIRVTPLTLRGH